MIKTRKIELTPKGDKKIITNLLKRYSEVSCEIGNNIIRNVLMDFFNLDEFKKNNPQFSASAANQKFVELLGHPLRNTAYNSTKQFSNIPSTIRGALSNTVGKTLTENKRNIISGKVSIPSFTKDKMPIYFMFGSSKLSLVDNKYHFKITNDLTFILHFGRDRSDNKSIIDRVLSGEYKGCDSNITIQNGKIFLNLTYKFEPKKLEVVNKDVVLGIDMGINRPVTLARSDGKYVPQIDLGESMSHTRMQFQKRRKDLSKSLKYAKGGHGRDAKMKKLDAIRKSEHNYIETMNHKLSRIIIKYCVENAIGKIRMEDLTGITKDSNEYFFKSWPYYQLQQMIEYKAKEFGIEIEYVVAKDTSKTCHCCGVVHETARDKKDVSKFTCQTVDCNMFGKVQDADINAAINISRKEGFKEKPKSKKGKIETWKKKQELLEDNLIM